MKDRTNARAFAVVAIAALWLAAPAAAQVVRVYAVRHRTAEELGPLVESALSGEGRAVADRRTNALVLVGSQRAVANALELLAALDVRARTVVLHYESRRSDELESAGARVRWRASAGELQIGDVLWPRAAAAVDVTGQAARSASTLSGELRILEGQRGRIASGALLPLMVRRIQRNARGEVIEAATHYANAESGFEASPRVLRDGRVELALRRFDASMRPDGAIDHAGAETTLVLAPGATVALGGLARAESSQRGALVADSATGQVQESLLLVTVDVE